MSTSTSTLLPIDDEHRLVVTADRAWVVDADRTKISRDELRRPGESADDFRDRAKAWARVLVTYISPAN